MPLDTIWNETQLWAPNVSIALWERQCAIVADMTKGLLEYWQSNFWMMQELWTIYNDMLEQHRDPLTHLTTQGQYQNFMTWQKMRKQTLETALKQLQILKWKEWYIFPQQQQLENYIRTNLAFTFTFDRPDYNVAHTTFERIHEWERMGIKKFSPEVIEKNGETIFLIAPISWHFPTLLRKTIQALTDTWYEVCITDWKSCLQMSADTSTTLDDYTLDLSEAYDIISRTLEDGASFDVLAVCQPGPITLSSIALAEKSWGLTPRSVTIMASPLDTSVNPTQVWKVWESMSPMTLHTAQLVSPKSWKKVYPGTYQINNFIAANFEKHLKNYMDLAFQSSPLDVEQEKMIAFYHEYFAVMDIPYDFFVETVQRVFQTREWATGKVRYKDMLLDLSSIETPVAVVEWWDDDICWVWETQAAFSITGQSKTDDNYLLCEGAGHYGVFAGKSFRKRVIPFMKKFREKISI